MINCPERDKSREEAVGNDCDGSSALRLGLEADMIPAIRVSIAKVNIEVLRG
jgi:hypothetical protein